MFAGVILGSITVVDIVQTLPQEPYSFLENHLELVYENPVRGFSIPIIVSVLYGVVGWLLVGGIMTSRRERETWQITALGGALVGIFAGIVAIVLANAGGWEGSFVASYKRAVFPSFIILVVIWGFAGLITGLIWDVYVGKRDQ